MHLRKRVLIVLFVLASSILLITCRGKTEEIEVSRVVTEKETIIEQETIVEQQTIIEYQTVIERETIIVEVTPTPEPVEVGPRTLVI